MCAAGTPDGIARDLTPALRVKPDLQDRFFSSSRMTARLSYFVILACPLTHHNRGIRTWFLAWKRLTKGRNGVDDDGRLRVLTAHRWCGQAAGVSSSHCAGADLVFVCLHG